MADALEMPGRLYLENNIIERQQVSHFGRDTQSASSSLDRMSSSQVARRSAEQVGQSLRLSTRDQLIRDTRQSVAETGLFK